jgi:formylglycine-generating enzyme required for sulfatase activity
VIEGEARVALADARGFAKRGDAENTMKRLRKIVETYPKSTAAKEAVAAMERAEQGLPVFPDGNLVIAQNVAVPEPAEAPTIEVAATTPQANLPVGPALVSVQAPPTPPDPYRELALPLEHGSGAANPLPAGFRPRIQAGVHPSGWPWEITCDQDGSAMRFIPSGEFLMGRDDGPLQERPSHQVALGGYYIDQHETTALQFARFQEATHAASAENSPSPSDDAPIALVSWRDATAYMKWCGKRLPTEAQWEAAARTIDGRLYPWGPGAPPWTEPREPLPLKPVMSQPLDMSPYGVFDLAGNAAEWTADWYDPRYFQQFRNEVAVEPTGPARLRSKLPTRVVKGGSKSWESSWRDGARPDSRNASLGFRGALPVELLQAPAPVTPTAPQGPAKVFFAF